MNSNFPLLWPEKGAGTKVNESFKEIWRKSMDAASSAFSTGDLEGICRKYGVDRDDARMLDTLHGPVAEQLAVMRDRGRTAVFTVHFVKDHSEERYEVRTIEDWNAMMSAFGIEDDGGGHGLDYAYYAVRVSSRTRGKCTVIVTVE